MPTSVSNSPRGGLICVGSELLRGKINTHASTLALRLASIGLELNEEHTAADELPALVRTIRSTLERCDIVIVTGGLGPTFDDITREAAAAATGRRLVRSKALLRGLTRKFRRARFAMPPANARQADLLEGALPLENSRGTAPGQWLLLKSSPAARAVILLPGPPSELQPMLERDVLPRLRKTFPAGARAEAHLHFVGVPESIVDHKIRPIVARTEKALGAKVQFTILAHLGLVDFDIFVSGRSRSQAKAAVARLVREVRARLGEAYYGMNEDFPLERVIMNRFIAQKATLAVAESCTGGMLGEKLTTISGSSRYFQGGVISYSNRIKEQFLGVPERLLVRHGAVSEPVARAMAEGVRRAAGATCGLSITGIAGPDGGTRIKPVGLVYVGLATAKKSFVKRLDLKGSREAIRQRAVIAAMDFLRHF